MIAKPAKSILAMTSNHSAVAGNCVMTSRILFCTRHAGEGTVGMDSHEA
jgi:hypothetical protein